MKLKETITAPIAALVIYGLYYVCFVSSIAQTALAEYDEYSIISGIVLIMMTLLLPAVFYAKLKGVGYSMKMNFLSFKGSRIIFSFCMLVCLCTGIILIALALQYLGLAGLKYSLVETYVLRLSNRELPIVYRFVTYAVLPAFAEEFFYRGVLVTEYKQSGFLISILFSALLFAFGQFSLVAFPAFLFVGIVMGVIYYVSESLIITVSVRLAFNLVLFFFEDAVWSLLLKQSNFVFFICLTTVLFLLFLTLGLSEAQRIYYTKGVDAEESPDFEMSKELTWRQRFASAILSPTFIMCAAAFFAVTLFG
ncbi:MAG: CPBP family intramembrane metalloprotease [Clostridiales bacterium]|nr:CPBP family intramembrane metalloprotease [Clostridiales bacterium]